MTDTLHFARLYAKAGYPVLPVWGLHGKTCQCPDGPKCKTPGKHPIHKAWTHSATTDVDKVVQTFKRYPKAHIGIMPPEGHCIIDVDPRNGGMETLRALANGKKLPPTVTQVSGGKGLHLIYEGEPNGPLGKGIDVKRHGRGFVVAAPAGHISGGKYSWRTAPWDTVTATLPKQLRGRQQAAELTPLEGDGIYKDDTPPPSVPINTMREALAHVSADDYHRWINIGHALKHAYGDDGEELWVEWSKSSSKYEDGDEAKWSTLDHNRDRPLITVRSIMSIARRSGYRPLTKEFDNTLWALGDITRYVETEAPSLDWVYAPCIPAGKVCLLAGAGGSSKSYLTLTLAMHMACALPMGPFVPSKMGKALMLVAEESHDDLHRRIQNIMTNRMFAEDQLKHIVDNVGVVPVRGLDWRLMSYDEAGNLQETDRVDYIIDEIRALGDVRMLVLDPLVAFNGANENDNTEMARLMFTLDRIAADTGCAVVVIHHVSKGGQVTSLNEATQAVVRGASSLVDNARACILLTRMPRGDAPLYNIPEDDAGRFVVARVVKNNYGPHTPDTIFAVERGGSLRHAPEVQQVHRSAKAAQRLMDDDDTQLRILRTLEEHSEWQTLDIAEAVNRSTTAVKKHVQTLLEQGWLKRLGIGRGTRYEVTPAGQAKLSQNQGQNSDISELL